LVFDVNRDGVESVGADDDLLGAASATRSLRRRLVPQRERMNKEADQPDNGSAMPDVYYLENLEQLRALGEPTRYRIISLLIEPHTGAQLARAIGIPRARAHYHLKLLEQVGLVRRLPGDDDRPAGEHYYEVCGRMLDFTGLVPSASDRGDKITIESFEAVTDFLATMLEVSRTSILTERPEVGRGLGAWFDYDGSMSAEAFDHFVAEVRSLREAMIAASRDDGDRTERFHVTLFLSRIDPRTPEEPPAG